MRLLSVVVALYNEEDNIEPLFANLRSALKGMDYELVMVDDGSRDNTIEKVKQHMGDDTKLVVLMKNYGQSAAMAAGIQAAEGQYIATMDGDLQNDPDDIPMMLNKLRDEEWDLVAGIRAKRQDGMLLRKIPSKIANALIRRSTGVRLHDYGCTLKVFESRIAKNLGLYGELHRFIPVLAALQGARMTEVPVKHHARIHGVSKYGIGRTSKVASDLVLMIFRLKYFQKPMHLFGPPGFLLLLSGVVINLYLLFLKIRGERIGDRPLLILGVILLLAGLLLLLFGILSDIMMRTYYESQNRLPYQVRKVHSNQKKG
jgi:glycosyltransferase involved in cell wall biosynthesis